MDIKKEYHPQMHSAEHILNQTMVRMFNKGRSFSQHIERKKSKCDYKYFDRNLSAEELLEIEKKVNEQISRNLQVIIDFMPREEAKKQFNLERLPEDAGDNVRIIRIGDYDACPCIGEHVTNTNEIGTFKIISSGFEDSVLRIRYKLI